MINSVRITFSLLFVLLMACDSIDHKQYLISAPCDNENKASVVLKVVDTLNIIVPDNSVPSFGLTQIIDDRYLIGLMKEKSRFEIYDIQNESFFRSIQLDPNFITKLGSFYAYSLDSIFVTQDIADVLLIDQSGEIINKWDLGNAPINWESPDESVPEYFFYSSAYTVPYYDPIKQNLHVTFNCTDIWYFEDRADYEMHGVYNILTEEWQTVFGKNPGIYSVKESILYPYAFSQPYQLVKGDSTYISYPIDHNIYIYNNISGELIDTRCAATQYMSTLPEALDYYEGLDDFQQRLNMVNSAPVYGVFNYHADVEKFTRIVALEQPLKMADGTLNIRASKKTAVMIFDKNLNLISEYLFTENQPFAGVGGDHGVSGGAVTKTGFLGSFKSKFNTSDDTLRIRVNFKIDEVD